MLWNVAVWWIAGHNECDSFVVLTAHFNATNFPATISLPRPETMRKLKTRELYREFESSRVSYVIVFDKH